MGPSPAGVPTYLNCLQGSHLSTFRFLFFDSSAVALQEKPTSFSIGPKILTSNTSHNQTHTMDSPTKEIIASPTKTSKTAKKRGAAAQSKIKSGRVEKSKTNANQSRARDVVTTKKAVNNYILFRCKRAYSPFASDVSLTEQAMMNPIFPNWTQADRSRFIRAMWEQEQHKTTYGLMARVWTFIRDNSNYRNLAQFLAGAGIITCITGPDVWLELYHMELVRIPSGEVDLLQLIAPAPGAIPSPRDLTDFDLLHELILKGLPLERPAQLLQQMAEHSLHIMTVNKKQDFSFHNEDLDKNGRAVVSFAQQMDYNPVATFADILPMDPADSFFNLGVNVIDVENIADFDRSQAVSTGPQTQYRFEWDTNTAHHAQPQDGAIDTMTAEDAGRVWGLDQPNT